MWPRVLADVAQASGRWLVAYRAARKGPFAGGHQLLFDRGGGARVDADDDTQGRGPLLVALPLLQQPEQRVEDLQVVRQLRVAAAS